MAVVSLSASATWTQYSSYKYQISNTPNKSQLSTPTFMGAPRLSISGVSRDASAACINGNRIEFVQPIRKCTKWAYERDNDGDLNRDDGKKCQAYKYVKASATLNGTKLVCENRQSVIWAWERETGKDFDRDDCQIKRSVSAKTITTYTVFVAKKVGKNTAGYKKQYGGKLLFKEVWSVPSCNGSVNAGK